MICEVQTVSVNVKIMCSAVHFYLNTLYYFVVSVFSCWCRCRCKYLIEYEDHQPRLDSMFSLIIIIKQPDGSTIGHRPHLMFSICPGSEPLVSSWMRCFTLSDHLAGGSFYASEDIGAASPLINTFSPFVILHSGYMPGSVPF